MRGLTRLVDIIPAAWEQIEPVLGARPVLPGGLASSLRSRAGAVSFGIVVDAAAGLLQSDRVADRGRWEGPGPPASREFNA